MPRHIPPVLVACGSAVRLYVPASDPPLLRAYRAAPPLRAGFRTAWTRSPACTLDRGRQHFAHINSCAIHLALLWHLASPDSRLASRYHRFSVRGAAAPHLLLPLLPSFPRGSSRRRILPRSYGICLRCARPLNLARSPSVAVGMILTLHACACTRRHILLRAAMPRIPASFTLTFITRHAGARNSSHDFIRLPSDMPGTPQWTATPLLHLSVAPLRTRD